MLEWVSPECQRMFGLFPSLFLLGEDGRWFDVLDDEKWG